MIHTARKLRTEEIEELEKKLETIQNDNVVDRRDEEQRCKEILAEYINRKELICKQKSKEEWLKHGDKNTSSSLFQREKFG